MFHGLSAVGLHDNPHLRRLWKKVWLVSRGQVCQPDGAWSSNGDCYSQIGLQGAGRGGCGSLGPKCTQDCVEMHGRLRLCLGERGTLTWVASLSPSPPGVGWVRL